MPAVVSITACLPFISVGDSGVVNAATFGGAACWNHSARRSTSTFMGERICGRRVFRNRGPARARAGDVRPAGPPAAAYNAGGRRLARAGGDDDGTGVDADGPLPGRRRAARRGTRSVSRASRGGCRTRDSSCSWRPRPASSRRSRGPRRTRRSASGAASPASSRSSSSSRWHSRVEERERWHATLARVNDEAAARVRARVECPSARRCAGAGPGHAFAGRPRHLRPRLGVPAARLRGHGCGAGHARRLADRGALRRTTIRLRQAAVAELAPPRREREEFAALGRLVEPAQHALDGLLRGRTAARGSSGGPGRRGRSRLVAGVLIGLLAAHVAGAIDRPLWLYPLAVSVVLLAVFGKRIASDVHARLLAQRPAFATTPRCSRASARRAFTSPLLVGAAVGTPPLRPDRRRARWRGSR